MAIIRDHVGTITKNAKCFRIFILLTPFSKLAPSIKCLRNYLGVVAYFCHPNTQKAETGGLC